MSYPSAEDEVGVLQHDPHPRQGGKDFGSFLCLIADFNRNEE